MMLKLCHWQKKLGQLKHVLQNLCVLRFPFYVKGFFFFLPVVLDAKTPQCSTLTSWSNFIYLKTNSKISVLISKH